MIIKRFNIIYANGYLSKNEVLKVYLKFYKGINNLSEFKGYVASLQDLQSQYLCGSIFSPLIQILNELFNEEASSFEKPFSKPTEVPKVKQNQIFEDVRFSFHVSMALLFNECCILTSRMLNKEVGHLGKFNC